MTTAQNRYVWVLAKNNTIDNDLLHDLVFAMFKKKSLKQLTKQDAIRLISHLKGEPQAPKNAISPGQKRRITYLFYQTNFSEAKRIGWLFRYAKYSLKEDGKIKLFKKSDFLITQITGYEANKLIGALSRVKAWKNKKNRTAK